MAKAKNIYIYRVILPYTETANPKKKFKIEYTVEAENRETARKAAEEQFFGYLQYDMASWVRTLERDQIRVWRLSPDLPQTSQSIDELCTELESKDLEVVYRALRAIGEIQDSTPSSQITRLFSHPDEEISSLAAETLGRIGDPANIPYLVSAFKPDANPRLKASILSSLGKLAGTSDPIQDLLATAIGDSDARVRANAVEVIEKLFLPKQAKLLLPMLADEDNRVRANVLKALWQSHSRPSLGNNLDEMLNNPNPWMRASAAFVLEHIEVEGRVKNLGNLLNDPDPVVSRSAWRAISALKESDCIPHWLDYMLKHPENDFPEIRAKMVEFGSEALDFLYDFLSEQKTSDPLIENIRKKIEDEIYLREGFLNWLKAKSRRVI
ncbi:MAG: HEAT repeat domain-containing protein [Candidatus Riflebacteria bacterium]|nr:HEAT repeat domain-containing protein [Candidatus Riflebacteria bacterium]